MPLHLALLGLPHHQFLARGANRSPLICWGGSELSILICFGMFEYVWVRICLQQKHLLGTLLGQLVREHLQSVGSVLATPMMPCPHCSWYKLDREEQQVNKIQHSHNLKTATQTNRSTVKHRETLQRHVASEAGTAYIQHSFGPWRHRNLRHIQALAKQQANTVTLGQLLRCAEHFVSFPVSDCFSHSEPHGLTRPL